MLEVVEEYYTQEDKPRQNKKVKLTEVPEIPLKGRTLKKKIQTTLSPIREVEISSEEELEESDESAEHERDDVTQTLERPNYGRKLQPATTLKKKIARRDVEVHRPQTTDTVKSVRKLSLTNGTDSPAPPREGVREPTRQVPVARTIPPENVFVQPHTVVLYDEESREELSQSEVESEDQVVEEEQQDCEEEPQNDSENDDPEDDVEGKVAMKERVSITDIKRKKDALRKRKKTLLSKCFELESRTDAKIAMIIYHPGGKMETYVSSEWKGVLLEGGILAKLESAIK